MHYERITLMDGTRFVLRIAGGESERFLRGVEVRMDGDEVAGTTFDQRRRVIDKACIRTRTPLRMNPTYAELEEE